MPDVVLMTQHLLLAAIVGGVVLLVIARPGANPAERANTSTASARFHSAESGPSPSRSAR